ncbi:TPA: hypothetical protein DCZ46_04015 [Candidatus Campbellbacteria bacterium]|jgi:hypothetical protein|nr:MAG: hypothetical protein UR58_C0001G0479 [Candidatus Campbellbacteria bacterium GW2011_OD1_34_28]KKP75001.1 MAG: hypothetical protein UR74_C0002G0267 [Candidatus Campbellbacteria bacterium GW2011_GWD2_35_24]KKP75887.1 MAG: hypothetical protein UR75_C0002G0268 [Candidatus Campbellbacteria bacterium GW2011_GWC2_35_28]KKP76865.1 MAG: hypothetical protein UR76_C0002G0066 [Candidatus Campbellbacteria bacterium GW2011_GWC1_35_31]KKP78791.1 MAG: hypothetical protein UR79_C0002G0066 [Candidatus Cam
MTNEIILEKDHPAGTRLVVGGFSLVLGCMGADIHLKAKKQIEATPEGTPNREEALRLINRYCN